MSRAAASKGCSACWRPRSGRTTTAPSAAEERHRWPALVSDVVFLATPLGGAPLVRATHWLELLLGRRRYTAPFARLGRLRSAGITDLRHGSLVDEDWVGFDRLRRAPDRPQHVPLPAGVRCHTVAATLGREDGDLRDRLLGDGLVPLESALGHHTEHAQSQRIPSDRQWIAYGMNHLDLLGRVEVYERVRSWLESGEP